MKVLSFIWFHCQKIFREYSAVVICFFAATIFISRSCWDSHKLKKDFLQISGPISHYSFEANVGPRNYHKFYLWLSNYPCTFQISADNIDVFKKQTFEREIQQGDTLSLVISELHSHLLLSENKEVVVLSVSDHENDFLAFDKARMRKQEKFALHSGLFFLIMGVIIIFIKRFLIDN